MTSKISSTIIGSGIRFRETFKYGGKEVMNFFPTHMSKGLNQMQKTLKAVDCIVEVHDARIPITGRNYKFEETMMVRPRVLILNKIDLANMKYHRKVEEKLKSEGIQKVLYTCCKEDMDVTIKSRLLPAVMKLIESTDRFNRSGEEDFNVLVIGIPNVGKSSLINALRRMHTTKGGKATPVGAKPGVTKSVMEKIRVSDKPKIYVFDTPGIMLPNIPDMDVGMKLAVCANLQDHRVGIVTIADYMLFFLNKHSYFKYVQVYGLDQPVDDIFHLLTQVAKMNNLVLKTRSLSGGYLFRPDYVRAADIIVRDFRTGVFGKVNLDEDYFVDIATNDTKIAAEESDLSYSQ